MLLISHLLYSKKTEGPGSLPQEVEVKFKWAGSVSSAAGCAVCLHFSLSLLLWLLCVNHSPSSPHTVLHFGLYGLCREKPFTEIARAQNRSCTFSRAGCVLFTFRARATWAACSLFPKSRRNDCFLFCNLPYIFVLTYKSIHRMSFSVVCHSGRIRSMGLAQIRQVLILNWPPCLASVYVSSCGDLKHVILHLGTLDLSEGCSGKPESEIRDASLTWHAPEDGLLSSQRSSNVGLGMERAAYNLLL